MPAVSATLINSNPQEIDSDQWELICFELYARVRALSPVRTGAYRAAWTLEQVSLNIWTLTNDSEYASFLEDGWSEQAPGGILEPALQSLPGLIREAIGRRPRGQVTVTVDIPDYNPL